MNDQAFLQRIHQNINRHERSRFALRGAAVLLVAAALFAWPRADPTPAPTEPPAVALTDHPVAAVLLEAALLRLDGIGDRTAARPRLNEIVHEYPGTRSARRAAVLLKDMGDMG